MELFIQELSTHIAPFFDSIEVAFHELVRQFTVWRIFNGLFQLGIVMAIIMGISLIIVIVAIVFDDEYLTNDRKKELKIFKKSILKICVCFFGFGVFLTVLSYILVGIFAPHYTFIQNILSL